MTEPIPDMPGWAIFLMCFVAAGLFVGGSWAWWYLTVGRHERPVTPPPASPATLTTPAPAAAPALPTPTPPAPAAAVAVRPSAAVERTRAALAALPAAMLWSPEVQCSAAAPALHIPLLHCTTGVRPFDLHSSRHMVVAGASRQGKGNALQLLCLSALQHGPTVVQVWVLDPKDGLDYHSFALHLAHTRLYTDGPRSDGGLQAGYRAALAELRHRNSQLVDVGARNHVEGRQRGLSLPILAIVADEVAELDMECRAALCRLARTGAAAGIVLLVATQYPTVEALPSQVQSNCLERLVFALTSSRHTPVALALGPGEPTEYEPSSIGQPGVAVWRTADGQQHLGRVPLVSDAARDAAVADLVARWPREVPGTVPSPNTPQDGRPGTVPGTAPPVPAHQEAEKTGTVPGTPGTDDDLTARMARIQAAWSAGHHTGESLMRAARLRRGVAFWAARQLHAGKPLDRGELARRLGRAGGEAS